MLLMRNREGKRDTDNFIIRELHKVKGSMKLGIENGS